MRTEITVVHMMNVVRHTSRSDVLRLQSDVHRSGIQWNQLTCTTCHMHVVLGLNGRRDACQGHVSPSSEKFVTFSTIPTKMPHECAS